jgi:hypothetical protein
VLAKTLGLRSLEVAAHRRLALFGWIAYTLSWVTPGLQEGWIGARAFIAAAQYGARFLFHPDSAAAFVLGVCLLLGWLANFSIFLPLSVRARFAWTVAPWLPFVAVLVLMSAPWPVRARVFGQLYFYPWALGIACIHIAMMQSRRGLRTEPEGPAGGFS